MANTFYTEGTGDEQLLHEAVDTNRIKVFKDYNAAASVKDQLEEGQVIATPDEEHVLDMSAIHQELYDNLSNELTEAIENNASVPVGTIVSIKNSGSILGYLPCDGSSFNQEDYPYLYTALNNSTSLPLVVEPSDFELNTELFTGKTFNGRQIYQYTYLMTQSIPGQEWVTLTPNGETYWPSIHNVDRILNYDISEQHSGTGYTDGTTKNGLFMIDKNTADKYTLRFWQNWPPQQYVNGTYLTIYYVKNEDDFTNAKYKYIRALSGVSTGEEADTVVAAIESIENKVAYNSLPIGSAISLANNSYTPTGYLLADGSAFDTDQYSALSAYLNNSDHLPTLYDPNSLASMPSVAYSTRSDYNPNGVSYTANMGNTLTELGLRTDGAGFPADGMLFIETYHWYDLWIEDTDGSIKGYMVASRDDTQSCINIPIKKGQKLYGWTRNGSGTPQPSTEWVQSTYTKLYIWYYERYQYIKAVSGIEENSSEATEVTNVLNAIKDKVAYCSAPVGNVLHLANNNTIPNGYLLCDGSTFDENEYPLLYSYLGNSNVLPDIGSGELDWDNRHIIARQENSREFTFEAPRSGYVVINMDGFNGSVGYISINGCVIDEMSSHGSTWLNNSTLTIPVTKGDVVYRNQGYTGQYTWYCYNYFIPYKYHAYIKGVTGIEDSTTESSEVVNAINAAKQNLEHYASNPVGSLLPLYGEAAPSGYLLCDGSTFDAETYPLLYSVLGSNVLPDLRECVLVGAGENTTHTIAAHDVYTIGQFKDDQLQSHRHTVLTQSCRGGELNYHFLDSSRVSAKPEFNEGTGNSYTNGITDCRNGTTTHGKQVGINYFIKAVSGIEEESTEANEVANAINTASTSLSNQLEQYKNELSALLHLDETVIAEGATTMTNVAIGAMNDSVLNYDRVKFYTRRSATSYPDILPVGEFDHEQMVLACEENASKPYSIIISGYDTEYKQIKFSTDGLSITALGGSNICYKIVGVGRRY